MTVNLSALAGAGQQFFDNNGNPLSGGKLYSYEAGTTTPQTTYTSASGATAHTNPIVLDSAGRVATGEIWVTAGQNYKFVLKTSAEVTLATWDNITGIGGTGIATNASLVEYDPPFAGAVTSGYTVQDKLAQTVSVEDFGAVGDGVTDDTAAIQAALNYGGKITGEGTFLISSKLTATKEGTWLVGPAASWGNEGFNGRSFRLLGAPSLTADFLIQFKNPDRANLRSVGMENVGIDLQTNSPDCGGLAVYGAYDASAFCNINITGVALGRIGFFASAGDTNRSAVIQTATFENIWTLKRAGLSTTPAVRTWGVQESTFINCKASHSSVTHAAWEFASSAGVTLISPSFVNASGYGLDIIEEQGRCEGVTFLTPTFENCLNTVRTRTIDAYMFGTISSVPSVGDTVRQPADGSTATGVVWQASAIGVYVVVTSGAFSTGTLYNSSGASIGTVSTISTFGGNQNIALTNPRTLGGAAVGSAAGGEFKALSNSRIELPNDSNTSFTHVYTADNSAINNTFIASRFGNMVASGRSNELRGNAELTFVYEGSASTDLWPFTNNQFSLVTVPSAVRKVTLIRPQATSGFMEVLGTGVTVLPYAASTVFRVYGGTLVLQRKDATTWVIESAQGNIITTTDGRVAVAPWTQTRTTTFAADSNTVAGCTILNTGATGTVSVNMSVIGAAATLVGTQFTIRRVASQILRVTPNAADTILGASAAGKYVQLDSDGAFLTLEVMATGVYNIIASQGTFSFQP
jgi:hypothetical protein